MRDSPIKPRMSEQRSPFLYLGVALIAIVGGYLLWYNFLQPEPSDEIGINFGNQLLEQEITGIGGESVKFSDYRGSILVIDFMAPWCAPCKAQFPILDEVNSIPGVEVITINVDPSYNTTFLQEFGEEEGISWFFGHGPFTSLEFEVTAIPTVLIVDQEGVIIYRGFFTGEKDFERILSPLLG